MAFHLGDTGATGLGRADHGAGRVRPAPLRHHGCVSATTTSAGEDALFHRLPEGGLFAAGLLDQGLNTALAQLNFAIYSDSIHSDQESPYWKDGKSSLFD